MERKRSGNGSGEDDVYEYMYFRIYDLLPLVAVIRVLKCTIRRFLCIIESILYSYMVLCQEGGKKWNKFGVIR